MDFKFDLTDNKTKLEITNIIVNGIDRKLDMYSTLRRCLVIDPLPPDCKPRYESEPQNYPTLILTKDNKVKILYEKESLVDEIKIEHTINTNLKKNKYNKDEFSQIVYNLINEFVDTFAKKENNMFNKILFDATQMTNNILEFDSDINLNYILTKANKYFSKQELNPTNILLKTDNFKLFMEKDITIIGHDIFIDKNGCSNLLLNNGNLSLNSFIAFNNYMLPDPEYIGVVPLIKKPTAVTSDFNKNITIKYSIGVGIFMPKSIIRIYIRR